MIVPFTNGVVKLATVEAAAVYKAGVILAWFEVPIRRSIPADPALVKLTSLFKNVETANSFIDLVPPGEGSNCTAVVLKANIWAAVKTNVVSRKLLADKVFIWPMLNWTVLFSSVTGSTCVPSTLSFVVGVPVGYPYICKYI